MGWNRSWAPYVPVAKRRAQAAREMAAIDKSNKRKGQARSPVQIATRKIATTFWGEAWCENLESYSDYENRLPRGRSYCRNGSILDLQIGEGHIDAMVSGSSLYKIKINIKTLQPNTWMSIKLDCAKSIHSMMDLLRGKLSNAVMQRLTQARVGLFPEPKEIDFNCSCPDSAYLCKHLAAVMYGIGNRLDSSPELLFVLRGVEQSELIGEIAVGAAAIDALTGQPSDNGNGLEGDDLGSLFGIDLVSKSVGPKKRSDKILPVKKLPDKILPAKKLLAKKLLAKQSEEAAPAALKRAAKGKTDLTSRIANAASADQAKTSERSKPEATKRETSSNVSDKTAASVSKATQATQDKPMKRVMPNKPLPQQTAPLRGLPDSVRKALEYLEQNPAPSRENSLPMVVATKRKRSSQKNPR